MITAEFASKISEEMKPFMDKLFHKIMIAALEGKREIVIDVDYSMNTRETGAEYNTLNESHFEYKNVYQEVLKERGFTVNPEPHGYVIKW